MTWISLVFLLALSSSAFANYGQSNGYGASLPKLSLLNVVRDNPIQRPILPTIPQGYGEMKTIEQPSYGQQDLRIQTGYASIPRTLPVQGYGAAPRLFDQPEPALPQPALPVTEADILCRGQVAETVIPLDEGRRFVVCLDDGKGSELFCPKGLFYHVPTRRCERKYGPPNYCASQPCLNGGQCIATDSSFQCQCAPGFDGQNCELDARVCQTQFPCGQSSDARCQSFRLGAALSYICIFQDGLAYGLNAQQIIGNPCQGVDGPQALTVTDKGFLMCDGERMSAESCPGGTIWEDNSKACVWPDMQTNTPQLDQSPSYGSYGQSRLVSGYGSRIPETPRLVGGYGSRIPETPRLVGGYGSRIPETPRLVSGYGSRIPETPKLVGGYGSNIPETPRLVSGYGSRILETPKLVGGYGSEIPETPKLVGGYGSEIPETPKLVGGYGSRIHETPKFVGGYDSRIHETPKFVGGYGSEIPETPKLVGGYGSEIPETPKLVGGYGSKVIIPSMPAVPKVIQTSNY